jgi:hypothetical protein
MIAPMHCRSEQFAAAMQCSNCQFNAQSVSSTIIISETAVEGETVMLALVGRWCMQLKYVADPVTRAVTNCIRFVYLRDYVADTTSQRDALADHKGYSHCRVQVATRDPSSEVHKDEDADAKDASKQQLLVCVESNTDYSYRGEQESHHSKPLHNHCSPKVAIVLLSMEIQVSHAHQDCVVSVNALATVPDS